MTAGCNRFVYERRFSGRVARMRVAVKHRVGEKRGGDGTPEHLWRRGRAFVALLFGVSCVPFSSGQRDSFRPLQLNSYTAGRHEHTYDARVNYHCNTPPPKKNPIQVTKIIPQGIVSLP